MIYQLGLLSDEKHIFITVQSRNVKLPLEGNCSFQSTLSKDSFQMALNEISLFIIMTYFFTNNKFVATQFAISPDGK